MVKSLVKNTPLTVKVLMADGVGTLVEKVFVGVMAPIVSKGI